VSELPPGWATVTLGEVCCAVSKIDPRLEPEADFTYIDIGGIDRLRITETKHLVGSQAPSRARQLVRAGDTVLSTVRTYLRKTALVPPELDGAVASTGFCVLRPGGAVDPRYVFHRVTAHDFVSRVTPLQTGSSYPAVRDRDVFSQTVELPPLNEQRRIVAAIEEHLSRLDAADASLTSALRRLDVSRSQFIEDAMRGDWPSTTLGEIAEIAGGVTKDAKRQADPAFVEVPYLRVANVQRGHLDLREVTTIRVPAQKAAALKLEPGDVLFNEGGDRDKLGRGWVWSGEIENCIHQNHVFRARLNADFDPRFVSWHGNTFGREWFETHGRQTTNLASLNLTTLKSFPVPAPPVEEQRRIVAEVEARLSVIDAMRASIERAQRRSAALRAAILERAFRGELVAQDPADEPAEALLARIRAERAVSAGATGRRRKTVRP
jgi:type I restriction enzyme S subunit